MTIKAMAATIACLIAATAAHAVCPTSEDMAKGVVTQTDDGQIEIHKAVAKDMVQVDIRFADQPGFGSVMQFGHGIYLRNVIPIDDGVLGIAQQEQYASDATLRSWAAPVPNATWSNPRPDGGAATSGPVRTVRVGTCSYDSFEVTLGFADDPNYTEVYTYFPSLGIGLLTEIIEDGKRDVYSYTTISRQ